METVPLTCFLPAVICFRILISVFFLDVFYSREIFNKWQAQQWWAENYDKVMELYNVQRFSHHEVPLPTPPRSEDEVYFTLCVVNYEYLPLLVRKKDFI